MRPSSLRALFLLIALLCCVAPAQGGFTLTPPAGWTAAQTENGTAYFPAGPGGRDRAFVQVLPAVDAQADPKAFVERMAAGLGQGATILKQEPAQAQPMPSGSTLVLKSLVTQDAGGGTLSVVVALVQGRETAVALLMFTPGEAAAQQFLPAFTGLLTSLRFTPGAAGTAASAGGAPGLGAKQLLPDVKPVDAAQFVAAGGDPQEALIPDEFRCYQEKKGDGLTPELTVQILPGGKYRTAYGGGAVRVVTDSSLRRPQSTGGPLNGAQGYLHFGDFGQAFSLSDVGADGLDFECYQRGPRENLALFAFNLNTPKPGTYPCVVADGRGTAAGALELLPGGQYRVGGQTGRYAVDFRRDQDRGVGTLDFVGGPLDGQDGRYSEDEDGLRRVSLSRVQGGVFSTESTDVDCRVVARPTPRPSLYGAARAPAPPRGSGGLSGHWVHSRAGALLPGLQLGPDFTSTMVLNSECPGNICWAFAFFDTNGYVFTGEPDVSADEADCTRTRPNGLPRCEVYRVQGGTLQIGKAEPVPFKLAGDTLTLAGRQYGRLLPLTGLTPRGAYTSKVVTNAVLALGGSVSDAALVFGAQGQFAYDRSSSTSLAGAGYVMGSSNTAATLGGKYSFQGNTLTLSYRDGRTVKLFAVAAPGEAGRPAPELLRLGGVTYTREDGK